MSRNRPASMEYAEVAQKWVTLDAAARLLEETKSAVFAQRCLVLNEKSQARAEMIAKAAPDWRDHLTKMVDARTAANRARVEQEFYKMRFWESNSEAANERMAARVS